jgi:hypothetical protein
VVVILFLTGTINQYLADAGKEHFAYDFKLLSGAAGLIYGYTLFIPLGLWGVLKWFGSESANLMECWALYGYSNLIWIPVALVSWSNLSGEHLRLLELLLGSFSNPFHSAQLRFRRRRSGHVRRLPLQKLVSGTSCSSHPRVPPMLTLQKHRYPVVSAIDAKPSRILLVVVVILHAGLAIAIKILFFAHGSPVTKVPATPSDPMQDPPKGDAGGDSRMFF